jgi:hypothetical protein
VDINKASRAQRWGCEIESWVTLPSLQKGEEVTNDAVEKLRAAGRHYVGGRRGAEPYD